MFPALNSRDLYLVFVLIQLSSLKYLSNSQTRTLPRWKDAQVTLGGRAGNDFGSPEPHTFLRALTLGWGEGFAFS